jgi:hypothetical protein
LHNLRLQLEQSQGRFKAGDMTRTSVDQARSRMNEAEADVASSKADVADSEAYYRYIIGRAPGKLSVPAMSKVQLPCNLQDALLVGENENPTLQAARHTANAANHSITSAKAAFYPTLSLEGSVRRGYDESRTAGAAGQDATLGLKLGVPIFNGGLDKSRVQQAKLVKTQRDLEVDDARSLVHRSVSSAWDSLKAIKLRKFAAIKRVSATEAAQKGLVIEYTAGQIALINVLDGRREVINARVTFAMVENDETIAHFTLLAALGHLDMRVAQELSQGRSYMAGGSCAHRPQAGEGRHLLNAKLPAGIIPVAQNTSSQLAQPHEAKPAEAQAVAAPRTGAIAALFSLGRSEDAPQQVQQSAPIATQMAVNPAQEPRVLASKPKAEAQAVAAQRPTITQPATTQEMTATSPAQQPITAAPQPRGAFAALMGLGGARVDNTPVAAISAPPESRGVGLPVARKRIAPVDVK